MLRAIESAIGDRDYLLGDTFSMADVIFGGTVRYMLTFKLLEPRPQFAAYVERLGARPALVRADERNAAVRKEHGLGG
jgi:glutathione S-transferase